MSLVISKRLERLTWKPYQFHWIPLRVYELGILVKDLKDSPESLALLDVGYEEVELAVEVQEEDPQLTRKHDPVLAKLPKQ